MLTSEPLHINYVWPYTPALFLPICCHIFSTCPTFAMNTIGSIQAGMIIFLNLWNIGESWFLNSFRVSILWYFRVLLIKCYLDNHGFQLDLTLWRIDINTCMHIYILNMHLIKVVLNLVLHACMYVCSCVLVNDHPLYESLLRKTIYTLFSNHFVIHTGNYFSGALWILGTPRSSSICTAFQRKPDIVGI